MAFPFGRQTSRDALEETTRSLKSSLTEGSSKIFGSVMGAKRGLIGGLTSTFDQVVNIVGGSGGDGETEGAAAAGAEDPEQSGGGPPKGPRPPKPPAPTRQRPDAVDSNGTVSRQQTGSPGDPSDGVPRPTSGAEFSDGKQRRKIEVKHPLKRRNTNPFMDDYDPSAVEPDYVPSDAAGVKVTAAEVKVAAAEVKVAVAGQKKRHSEAWIGRTGFGVGQDSSLLLQQQRRASEAAYSGGGGGVFPDPDRRHSDADSEGTEGCDDDDQLDEEAEEEDRMLPGSGSAGDGSDPMVDRSRGRSSGGGGDEGETDPVAEFMKYFVQKIFDPSQEITSRDKAKFGEMCQNGFGRLWFAKCINSQRLNDKSCVSEETFYALVQFFVIVFFESNEAEDYEPAKTLMNTCFTVHCEAVVGSSPRPSKQFLYSFVKDQPIWQSPRFWKAAFFYAVQQERASAPLSSGSSEKKEEKQDNQEDITYGQLRTFAGRMRALGLTKVQCLEFIRKQAAITNLSPDRVTHLRQDMERWTEDAVR